MESKLFLCPVCGAPLCAEGGSYRCEAGHTYDIARRGYVNLLTGRSGVMHGDNKEMIAARRAFLRAGYYDTLVNTVAHIAALYAPAECRLLDAGCGECHYTGAIARRLAGSGVTAEILAFDISKEALSLGGREHPTIVPAVASLYHLPIGDSSIDMLFEIFAPHCNEEYHRVLRPGGKMVLVIPGARHLFGLKEILYRTPYENETQDTDLPGFILEKTAEVDETITLRTDEDIWNLFTMTPYFYRTSPADKEKLRHAAPLQTEISFRILVYTKN